MPWTNFPIEKASRFVWAKRGMSWFRDVTDWLGGYPYEAATPGETLEFVRSQFGFVLVTQNIYYDLGVSKFSFGLPRR